MLKKEVFDDEGNNTNNLESMNDLRNLIQHYFEYEGKIKNHLILSRSI